MCCHRRRPLLPNRGIAYRAAPWFVPPLYHSTVPHRTGRSAPRGPYLIRGKGTGYQVLHGSAPFRNLYISIYMIVLFWGDSVRTFLSVSASVCHSQNWNSRSNSFFRTLSSGGGSNAPRPAVSVPHLAGIGHVG